VKDPSQFHHSRFPIFVHLDEEVSMYGAPTLDGSLFKATIELDVRPAASHPVGLDSMLTPEEKAESERVALRYFNNIYPVVAREECLSELYTADPRSHRRADPRTAAQLRCHRFLRCRIQNVGRCG
jgi:hypothetical protein